MDFAVTTGQNGAPGLTAVGREWARELAVPFLERGGGLLADFLARHGLDGVVLATARGPEIHSSGGRLFFHPGMSLRRMENIRAGRPDRMVGALQLRAGMSVLDCTLGLAADACVASFVVGAGGQVVGLEASPPLALVIKSGLSGFAAADGEVGAALRRIRVIGVEALAYLKTRAAASFDVVYFDPMFEHSVKGADNMKPLRPVAYDRGLDAELLNEARRVASRRVVAKILKGGKLPPGFPYSFTADGKYSRVSYAVLEAGR